MAWAQERQEDSLWDIFWPSPLQVILAVFLDKGLVAKR